MLGLAELIKVVGGLVTVFQDVSKHPEHYLDAYANRDFEAVGMALRAIHFGPNGILPVVERLAQGEEVQPEELSKLTEFNEIEENIESALHVLLRTYENSRSFSLSRSKELYRITHHKAGVRRQVKELLNEALTFGGPVPVDEAQALANEINELNQTIEAAEEALRRFRLN